MALRKSRSTVGVSNRSSISVGTPPRRVRVPAGGLPPMSPLASAGDAISRSASFTSSPTAPESSPKAPTSSSQSESGKGSADGGGEERLWALSKRQAEVKNAMNDKVFFMQAHRRFLDKAYTKFPSIIGFFRKYDRRGEGKISREEFVHVMKDAFGGVFKEREAHMLFNQALRRGQSELEFHDVQKLFWDIPAEKIKVKGVQAMKKDRPKVTGSDKIVTSPRTLRTLKKTLVQRIILRSKVRESTCADNKALLDAFRAIDLDMGGDLSYKEIRDALPKLFNMRMTDQQVKDMCLSMDPDGKGSISYKDFILSLAPLANDGDGNTDPVTKGRETEVEGFKRILEADPYAMVKELALVDDVPSTRPVTVAKSLRHSSGRTRSERPSTSASTASSFNPITGSMARVPPPPPMSSTYSPSMMEHYAPKATGIWGDDGASVGSSASMTETRLRANRELFSEIASQHSGPRSPTREVLDTHKRIGYGGHGVKAGTGFYMPPEERFKTTTGSRFKHDVELRDPNIDELHRKRTIAKARADRKHHSEQRCIYNVRKAEVDRQVRKVLRMKEHVKQYQSALDILKERDNSRRPVPAGMEDAAAPEPYEAAIKRKPWLRSTSMGWYKHSTDYLDD